MGARSSASPLAAIEYCTTICCSSWSSCTFNMDQHVYDLRLAQPSKKKKGAQSASIFALAYVYTMVIYCLPYALHITKRNRSAYRS